MLRKSPCFSYSEYGDKRSPSIINIHHEFTTRSQRWSPCWACWSWPHWCWQKPQPPRPTTSSPAPYVSTLSLRLVIASKISQNCNCSDPWEESFAVGNVPMQLFDSFLFSSFLVLFTKIICFSFISIKRSEFMYMFVVPFSCPISSIPTYVTDWFMMLPYREIDAAMRASGQITSNSWSPISSHKQVGG